MYVTGSYRLTPRSTECKHLLKDSAFNSLQDRICLQNSLWGGEQTHSQPSVYLVLVCDVWLWFFHFPMLYPGSGVIRDCIDSWSLLSFLLSYSFVMWFMNWACILWGSYSFVIGFLNGVCILWGSYSLVMGFLDGPCIP